MICEWKILYKLKYQILLQVWLTIDKLFVVKSCFRDAPVLKNVICNTVHNNMRHVTDLHYRIQKHTVVFTYIHMAVIKHSIKPVVESPF